MQVLSIETLQEDPKAPVSMRSVFSHCALTGNLNLHKNIIPPGKRIPLSEISDHGENVYSIITNGSIVTETTGETHRISEGETIFISAGHEHIAYNDGNEDCEILCVHI
ncbi:Cupin domain-containing protein [Bacillus sp. OV322]|uniref:cupin domain-containing protein n=1 Tax=Bacillus sp. OV322 TaxID=1882764 RepID=UPI0008E64CC4|nr:cupin domain-containing protein [Bacillus sp. OV322]SFC68049.1 Cupin domain-containing protein [Bacillus sp. OV322]